MPISDISTNSRSRIFFTTFEGNVAAGLNGPAAAGEGSCGVRVSGGSGGVAAETAAASRSKPDDEGVKIRILESMEAEVEIAHPV